MKLSTICMAVGAISLSLVSCTKDDTNSTGFSSTEITSLSQVKAPEGFNWSSSIKGNLVVNIQAPGKLYTENQWLNLESSTGQLLDRAKVQNGSASFNVTFPQDAKIYLSYPNTGDRMEVAKVGTVNFALTDYTNLDNFKKSAEAGSKKNTATSSGNDVLLSEDFENTSISADNDYDFYSYISINGWQSSTSSCDITTEPNGNHIVKANGNGGYYGYSVVGKKVDMVGGTSYNLSADFGGTNGKYLAIVFFDASQNYLGMDYYYYYGSNASGTKTISGTVPSTATYGCAVAVLYHKSTVDNFNLTGTATMQDADNDGVADENDDFPNDPSKAYASTFPSIGKQVVAFEDLWPAMGDYDFNDVVLASSAAISKDGDGNLVDATFKVSLDALGAGFHNGVGMMIYDGSGNAFSNGVIASVSGDATQDPQNSNGIIVTNDVFASTTSYYRNNGAGPSGTPDTITFTVTFNANAGSSFTPELYIFRSNDRSHEIHLPGKPGTAAADPSLYNSNYDNGSYETTNNLPWAIEVIVTPGDQFKHPLEKVDIATAYPQFAQWAISGGTLYQTWKSSGIGSKLF